MKILLPPSETKRAGGRGAPLDTDALVLPRLRPQRDAVIDALIVLSTDETNARRVLKLSERQAGDIQHNRRLRSSPTMPAVDRYTGVLYDELDASSLTPVQRDHLAEHVWIHSAPFGPVGALDPIPMYRLAAGTALPGIPGLRRHWAAATTAALEAEAPTFVLDLRSEAYVALGPVPSSVPSAYVRVVTNDAEGTRALNHFNKKAKGAFARAFAKDRPDVDSGGQLREWATGRGIRLRETDEARVWELVVR